MIFASKDRRSGIKILRMFITVITGSKQNGFSLLEVVVAIFILAIGLIGLVGLQAVALKNNNSAYNFTQAAQAAYNIIDRMRANSAGRNNYIVSAAGFGTQNNSCLSTTGCSASGMAGHDLFEWHKALADNLPGTPTGAISLSGGVYTVIIAWNERGGSNGNAVRTMSMDFIL